MQVRDVMTARPMIIAPEAPLETAVAVMRERRLRHLPVVDNAGQLVGIVTDRDIRSAILGPAIAEYASPGARGRLRALAKDLDDVQVSHVMTWDALTTGPDALVRRRHLPAVAPSPWSAAQSCRNCLKFERSDLAPRLHRYPSDDHRGEG